MKTRVRLLAAAFGFMASAMLSLAAPVFAITAPRLYFPQATVQAQSGSDVSLPLHIDGNGSSLDTVNVIVTFPADKLAFVGLNKAGSYFDTVVPAAPNASAGKLEFSVASLANGPTSSDELLGTLLFSANASSGNAAVSLSGSQAAHNGTAIDVSPGTAIVNFVGSSVSDGEVGIGDVAASGITVNSGVVHWHTNVPASSSVDYGTNTHYGFVASAAEMSNDHSVPLGAFFAGATIVHFRVTSVTADGQSQTTPDQTFITQGYTISIKVVNGDGKAVTGASVRVASGTAAKTDTDGLVTVHNVAPGNQKVVLSGGKAQFVAVQAHSGQAATTVQRFTLTAQRAVAPWYVIALAIVLTVAIVALLWRLRHKPNVV